ncbi:hypothetical protein BDZ89DRAFT_1072415 [Hymenopellis radicata]|nr:hypothetical protein BDZ89DRAFT_1072415 [Hymenopellis radicata]
MPSRSAFSYGAREGQPEARRINVVACHTEQVGRSCWVGPLSSIYGGGLVSECTRQSAYTSEEISAQTGRLGFKPRGPRQGDARTIIALLRGWVVAPLHCDADQSLDDERLWSA